MPETTDHPNAANAATDRELLDLAGRLHEAYQEAEPGHRLFAAAQAAEAWAWECYGPSIGEAEIQHRNYKEEMSRRMAIESEKDRWKSSYDSAMRLLRDCQEENKRLQESYPASRELLRQHRGMTKEIQRLESDQDRRESEQWIQGVVYNQALDMLSAAEARAAALANRCMVTEGERDRLQERVAELESQVPELQEVQRRTWVEAQNFHRLYARELGRVDALESRLADYDHQAEQAETYRLLYAETLAELDAAKGGKRPGTEPAAEVAWADWSKLRPGDEGYLPLNPGSDRPGNAGRACGAVYPHPPDGEHLQCTRAHDHDDDKHVAHGIDKDGNDYQIVAWREVQHGE